ncbi:hypothetical protein O3G_MSEX005915 [Manduca sexta]|uniref:Uncharacterized protein n=1 Tax=Manduca sexta TaxID=7130 RepID=A0A921Z1C3_MANSE|nr:hypothetical protein O3G_MSEX005915 [Manduca sexta]
MALCKSEAPVADACININGIGAHGIPVVSECTTMNLPVITALVAVAAAIELSPVDDARIKFYALEQDLWRNVTNIRWVNGVGKLGDFKLARAFLSWANHIKSISTLSSFQQKSWLWNKAWEHMHQINSEYEMFEKKMQILFSNVINQSYERVFINYDLSNATRQLDELLEHGDKLLYDLAEENENEDCERSVFRAKLIYDIYSTVALTELKGYAVTQVSWMLFRMEGRGNFSQEITESRKRYSLRAARAATEANRAISASRKEIQMCDPSKHIEGTTYEQVTRLLQGYVENEVDMNESGTCSDNCPGYTSAYRYGCYMDQFCAQQKSCYGTIRDCRFVESHMTVCTSSRSSNRLYEWIQYDGGRRLGEAGSCSKDTNRVYSWYRGFYHCSYCLCLCDDDTYSHRYFSLRAATSDVHTNKCVFCLYYYN